MAFFKYVAKNEHNETIKGKVEARTKDSAAAVLASRGLLVISVKAFDESPFASIRSSLFGVKQDDVVNLTRQLATMITAGLPLSGALSILAEQGTPQVASLVNELLRDIEGGHTFTQALAKHPKIFSRVYIQLVRAGEAGGVIDDVLNRLANNLEKEKEFRGKTKGAMIYPVIVLIAMFIVAFVMMAVVVPKLTDMYKDFDAELPTVTRILITISDFFASKWWLILLVMGGGLFGLRAWKKTKKGDRIWDRLMFKLPVFGELRKKIILTEFSRTMSLLLTAGVSLIEGIGIVSQAMRSVNYRDMLKAVTKKVEKGISFSEALSIYPEFPPILYQMISVGEETGKLDEVLLKLSAYFESESEQAVKNMTTALEPLIMIVLGVGVGFMVIAIIMPIYNLTSQF
jgi:type IV pilus assembly protein PilC